MDCVLRIGELIEEGKQLLLTRHNDNFFGMMAVNPSMFLSWQTRSAEYLSEILSDKSNYFIKFNEYVNDAYESNVQHGVKLLETIRIELELGRIKIKGSDISENDPLIHLENTFNKFHRVVKQMRVRHDNRETLDVHDEYDVQDLLHSLLLLQFDDVRAEEWTPSYAGRASRMDFVLKKEQIVIEVKRTRKSMKAKDLGEQLIIDIERYKVHPDCKTLFCFVYDPEGYIANPRGIENDLNRTDGNMQVKVFIRPE